MAFEIAFQKQKEMRIVVYSMLPAVVGGFFFGE